MIKTTRWWPDTCGCVVDYTWDSESSETDRVHTPVAVQPCEHHKDAGNLGAIWATVMRENRRKNVAVTLAEEAAGEAVLWTMDATRRVVLHPRADLRQVVSAAVAGVDGVEVV